ncbi:hypothetical protein Tco_0905067 [Tanacetum coccineum]
MESLKKVKLNRPFLKEIGQSGVYPKYMKDLMTNKPLIIENKEVKMNPRCSALLLNHLPPKEKDLGSFLLPCSIGRLDFNKTLAYLGASNSIMPFPMYKHLVNETMKKKILTEHWRKRFRVDYDDNNDFHDPEQCEESRNNEIRERIINNLHEEWFKGTSNDEDDIEGIINYLKPTSYNGFIDLDEEEYNKRRCRLLGMPYIEPPPIIVEQVKITRYCIRPGEIYTKLEVSDMDELPRTMKNIAAIRRDIMDEVFESYEDEMT